MVEPLERTHAMIGLHNGADPCAVIGAALPPMGRFIDHEGLRLARVAPHQILAIGDGAAPPVMDRLAPLGPAVIDLSDSRVAVRLSGPDARARLAHLVPLDLHPTRFSPGCCAQTLMAHLAVLLLQTGPDTYELHCGRSFAASFMRALEHA